jgi:hypothetical protein
LRRINTFFNFWVLDFGFWISPKLCGFGLFCAKFSDKRYNFNYGGSNLEITTENLLGAVINLPKNEFENFVSNARKLKKREESLIAKLDKFDLSMKSGKFTGNFCGNFALKYHD